MSRVVLDTNVVIAAFAARGLCEAVYEQCLERHELILSDFLISELKEKLKKKLKLSKELIEEIERIYRNSSQRVVPAKVESSLCRDPDDLPVLGTCLAGRAEYLVTGDKDLLEIGKFNGIPILLLRDFYNLGLV